MGVIGSFSELTKDFSPERRERIEQRKEQLRQEMTLAKNLNVKQAEISKIENRADMLIWRLCLSSPTAPLRSAPFRLWPVSPARRELAKRNSRWSRLRALLPGSTEARRPHRPFVLIETPPVGFEPTTGCLEGSCSIRLS